ncbi:MAG TPA: ABC transporter permease [Usitatibacter sp.]|nr:ABC transporter permease [Usitatibacter sp.]
MRLWLRLHALAFGDALRRLAAQPVASLLSILVLGVAIAIPVVAAVVLETVGATTAGFDTDPHVNVFLSLDASDSDAKRVGEALRAEPGVAAVRFIPKAQALAELQATTHLADLLSSFDRNPLPDAYAVRLRATDPARIGALKAAWSRLPKVDQVVADFEWAERLGRWARFGRRLVLGMAALLAAAVAFIVAHLIRLQVVTRREEIQVSELVGATAADVRRPFLYHGLLQGLLAAAAALALAAGFAAWIDAEVLALTPQYAPELKVAFLSPLERLAVVAGASLLGLAGAWAAVSRELRRFSSGG